MPVELGPLRQLVSEFPATPDGDDWAPLSGELAAAFGWRGGAASAQVVRTPPLGMGLPGMGLTRTRLGSEPSGLFVAVHRTSREALDRAALFAYHAAVPWGLIADPDGAVVFSARWVRDSDWYRLPRVRWDDAEEQARLLDVVTPELLSTGEGDHIAAQVYAPDRQVRAVDDALVDRLDFWRSEALRYSRGVAGIDDRLQTLFAQLFVLRTVEDRGLANALPRLESVLRSSGEADLSALRNVFDQGRTVVGSNLFDEDATGDVPAVVIGGIIKDLYFVRDVPTAGARYNFGWIDADVLGRAYEKYLSTVYVPLRAIPQLALPLMEQPVRDVTRSARQVVGVYYTPPFVVQTLASQCVEAALADDHIPRVVDFACGSGSFLVAAADVMLNRLRERDPDRNWAQELVDGRHILGVDVDERAVTVARLNLWTRFTHESHPLPLPRLDEVVVHGDALSVATWEDLPERYDVVLGNPPFLATGRTPTREALASRFRTAQGRFDYSYLFVELAVQKLEVGGRLGMVVPNRLFRNRDAQILRELLTAETDLLTVIDFGAQQIFEGATAYVGTITAEKRLPDAGDRAATVRVVLVSDASPRYVGATLARAAFGEAFSNDMVSAYDAPHPRGEGPWLLLSERAKTKRAHLEADSVLLPEVAGIFQGIRTGANDIFIVATDPGVTDSLVQIVNGLSESAWIERAILRPVLFGAEIHRYARLAESRFMIYPYRNGAVIPEAQMQEEFPQTWRYLSSARAALAGRTSIEASGLKWYELVRKRDEAWLTQPKLLIRDLAPATAFAPDVSGAFFLVGGSAVVPQDHALLLPLLAYLNSRVVSEYLSEITPSFRGGFQKFEPQHLQRVPVPRGLPEGNQLAEELSRLAQDQLEAHARGDTAVIADLDRQIEEVIRQHGAALQKPPEIGT